MKTLRIIRRIAWALVFIAAIVLGMMILGWRVHEDPAPFPISLAERNLAIGGAFTMVDHNASPVSESSFAGRPYILFFGFRHCPDVCPTTLSWLSTLLDEVAPSKDRPPIVMASVDPERDTPEVLRAYIDSFGSGIIGLTGSPEQVTAMTDVWKIYVRKVPTDNGGYAMDHSASIYLIDADGKLRGTLDLHDATPGNKAKKLAALLALPRDANVPAQGR